MLLSMLSLPRACTALSFRQRLRIYAWDRRSAGRDIRRLGCAEAMASGTSLRCLSFLCQHRSLRKRKEGHAWKRIDMCRDLGKNGKGGGFRWVIYTPVFTIS